MICSTTIDGYLDGWILVFASSFYIWANKELFNGYKSCDVDDFVMTNVSMNKVIGMNNVKMINV